MTKIVAQAFMSSIVLFHIVSVVRSSLFLHGSCRQYPCQGVHTHGVPRTATLIPTWALDDLKMRKNSDM